jgi:hypothetical protein
LILTPDRPSGHERGLLTGLKKNTGESKSRAMLREIPEEIPGNSREFPRKSP